MKGIQQDRLEAYFAEHVDGAMPPLRFELIKGGRSNLTYLVEDAKGAKRVLRRPPTGAVLATAHDMGREHRILSGLIDTDVPVPRTLALCQEDSINDAPFYVMEYVEGDVLVSAEMTAERVPKANRGKLGMHIIEVLANLHRIEPNDVGLGNLGRREDYLGRQLKRWKTQWEKSKTRELPMMDEAHAILEAKKPEQMSTAIVHGDYRIGNFLTDSAKGKIEAVLDWELCTLGDPLADVGYLMNDWNGPDDSQPTAGGASPSATTCGGFPHRAEILARYEELTGFSTKNIDYYRAFQYWRLAAIVEGVLSRYKLGVMGDSVDIGFYEAQTESLASAALALAQSGEIG